MVIGKQINRYYLRFAHLLLLGLAALVMVDYLTLIVPNLYQKVINGINLGYVEQDGISYMVSVGEEITELAQMEELLRQRSAKK